jgi:hypothetical protein
MKELQDAGMARVSDFGSLRYIDLLRHPGTGTLLVAQRKAPANRNLIRALAGNRRRRVTARPLTQSAIRKPARG